MFCYKISNKFWNLLDTFDYYLHNFVDKVYFFGTAFLDKFDCVIFKHPTPHIKSNF
jgi:hypothetical protein